MIIGILTFFILFGLFNLIKQLKKQPLVSNEIEEHIGNLMVTIDKINEDRRVIDPLQQSLVETGGELIPVPGKLIQT